MEAIKEFYENNKNISLKIKDIYGDFNLIGYNLLNNTLIGLLKVIKIEYIINIAILIN